MAFPQFLKNELDSYNLMEKRKKWDDIPSIEEMGEDWENRPNIFFEKRAFVRIKGEDVSEMLKVREIFVKIITAEQTYIGHLLDISAGGLLLDLPVLLEEDLPVKVGFFLGTEKITSKAEIRRPHKIGQLYTTGIKFVDLKKESAEYIDRLFVSKILRQTR